MADKTQKVITTVDGTFTDQGDLGGPDKKNPLAVSYLNVLPTRRSDVGWFEIFADPMNAKFMLQAGTAIYSKTSRITTSNYAPSYASKTTNIDTVSVNLDLVKKVNRELESATLARYGVETIEGGLKMDRQLYNQFIDSATLGIDTYHGAKATAGLIKAAGTVQTLKVPIAKTGDLLPNIEDSRQYVWAPLFNQKSEFLRYVGRNILGGANPDEVYAFCNPIAIRFLIQATSNLGSDIATRQFVEGKVYDNLIAGIKIIPANFLGQTFTAGDIVTDSKALDEDETFDFSGVDIILTCKGVFGYPVAEADPISVVKLITNKNALIFSKFVVNKDGGVAIFPEAPLIKAYKIEVEAPST